MLKKPYCMTREKKSWLRVELQKMWDADFDRPSVSPFPSPVTIAPKEDGSFRFCRNYHTHNQQTTLISFLTPRIDSINYKARERKAFSQVDLCKGSWQVPLTEDPKVQTAFTTPFGRYEYNRLPFGLKNSPAWFQKMMTTVLIQYIGISCNVYLDNVIIYSRPKEEHVEHLTKMLSALSEARLKLNLKKSEFF